MRTKTVTKYFVSVFAVAIALGGLLAACGTSSKNHTAASKTSSSTASSPPSTGSPKPMVTTKKDAKLGTILADDKGLTVYTLTKDGQPVTCTGACQSVWPPLEFPAGAKSPNGANGVSGLTAVAGPDGKQLIAAGGLPLYRFVKDKDSGDAYGDGIQSFGGVWKVVSATGTANGGAPTTAPMTAKSGY